MFLFLKHKPVIRKKLKNFKIKYEFRNYNGF